MDESETRPHMDRPHTNRLYTTRFYTSGGLRLNGAFGGDATGAADLLRHFFQIFYVV